MAEAAPRRTFGPVVLLGLAAAGLCAVAGNRTWVQGTVATPEEDGPAGYSSTMALDLASEMPLASALSLVLLASWGVLLVTRRRVRRAMAALALVAALGVLATVMVGARSLPASLRESVAASGTTAEVGIDFTGWYAAAAVGAVCSVVAAALALRFLRHWPEMGSRYDAPASTGPATATAAPGDGEADPGNLDLWKAIDEGRDPTA